MAKYTWGSRIVRISTITDIRGKDDSELTRADLAKLAAHDEATAKEHYDYSTASQAVVKMRRRIEKSQKDAYKKKKQAE